MFDTIYKMLELPELYEKTEAAFWDDGYISGQMLKAHLDPDFDGASRKSEFIDKSAAWIARALPPQSCPLLLDVGCGPGLYAERFTGYGYRVTGVDFSRRSIGYAQASAAQNGLEIDYQCQDYLNLQLNEKGQEKRFDLAVMIYCDYGALSTENRRVVLQNIYRCLKPGGKLLLDVFSMAKYNGFEERQTWEMCPNGGFWREKEYVALNRYCKFTDRVTLDQITVLSEGDMTSYYLWNSYFTKEALMREAEEAGFHLGGIYGDAAGSRYCEDSPTICVILEK